MSDEKNDISEPDKIKLKFDAIWKARDNEIGAIKERSLLVWGFLMFCYGGYGILVRDLLYKTPIPEIRFQAYNLALLFLSLVCFRLSVYWTKMMKGAKAWAENFDFIAEAFQHKFFRLSDKATSCPYALKLKFGTPEIGLDSMFHRKNCQNCQQDPSYACVFSVTEPGTLYYPDVDSCLLTDKAGAFSPASVTIAIARFSMFISLFLICAHSIALFKGKTEAANLLSNDKLPYGVIGLLIVWLVFPVIQRMGELMLGNCRLWNCIANIISGQNSMGLLDVGKVHNHCRKCLNRWNKIGGRKMKKSKSCICRIATLLLSLCFSITSFANTEIINGIKWTYTVSNGEAMLYNDAHIQATSIPTSTSGDIVIPSSLGGYPVTSIGFHAFMNCVGLTSVMIPDTVTSIDSSAFAGCSSLVSVTIPDSVTSIGIGVFSDCNSLYGTLPSSPLVRLVDGWVIDCEDSISGDIDLSGVRGISPYAFQHCSSLTSVTIPDSVVCIGDGAFIGCDGLTSVEIPDSVLKLGREAFHGCDNLKTVTIGRGIKLIDYQTFRYCSLLEDVHMSDAVTEIGAEAFSECRRLESIELPSSLTNIYREAFSKSALTSITIPGSVADTGYYAFQDCWRLETVTICDGVKRIRDFSFAGCSALSSVSIPNSVQSIGQGAFRGSETKLFDDEFDISGLRVVDGWVIDRSSQK